MNYSSGVNTKAIYRKWEWIESPVVPSIMPKKNVHSPMDASRILRRKFRRAADCLRWTIFLRIFEGQSQSCQVVRATELVNWKPRIEVTRSKGPFPSLPCRRTVRMEGKVINKTLILNFCAARIKSMQLFELEVVLYSIPSNTGTIRDQDVSRPHTLRTDPTPNRNKKKR
jgi:hypothetical protein